VILDLYAGPGGWDEGLRLLGYGEEVVGLELDPDACATARAAGFTRVQCDIRAADPLQWAGATGIIASPPCQTFSDAGKQEGRGSLDDLSRALLLVAEGVPCDQAAAESGLDAADPRTTLVLEPMRYLQAIGPQWLAMEEVKAVLPVWEAYARILRRQGWHVWAGILNAAHYGVPQARKRAILMGHRTRPVHPPAPTHTRDDEWVLFDEREPWVTMAQALNLGPRPADLTAWAWDRPATTVVRSFRPDVIAAPGYRTIGDPSRQDAPGSLTVTPEQMMILQGIRTDYPFTAKSESKIQSLIGAILPPPWAAAILRPLLES
jgi:DNA (cytosine-5)-methyltransferase 1